MWGHGEIGITLGPQPEVRGSSPRGSTMETYSYIACRNLWLAQQEKLAYEAAMGKKQEPEVVYELQNVSLWEEVYPDIDKDYTPAVRDYLLGQDTAQQYIDKMRDARMKKLCQDLHDGLLIAMIEGLDPTPKIFPEPFRFLDGLKDRCHE